MYKVKREKERERENKREENKISIKKTIELIYFKIFKISNNISERKFFISDF